MVRTVTNVAQNHPRFAANQYATHHQIYDSEEDQGALITVAERLKNITNEKCVPLLAEKNKSNTDFLFGICQVNVLILQLLNCHCYYYFIVLEQQEIKKCLMQ